MSDAVLDRICSSLDAPMVIVTASDGREHGGCLAGFHTRCSITPARWIVCISKLNHTYGIAMRTDRLAVHVLRADQHALAQLFGGVTEDAIAPHEKFERCTWRPGPGGAPVLAGCDWFAGRVLERLDCGDHVAHLLDVAEAHIEHAPAPQLGFQAAHDIHPGHPA